jgi:PAS domain S-box-containing protein
VRIYVLFGWLWIGISSAILYASQLDNLGDSLFIGISGTVFVFASALVLHRLVSHDAQATTELRTSEERFRAAMVGSLDAVYFLTAVRNAKGEIEDFTFTDLNPKGESLISMTREQVIGQRLCELIPINRTGGFFEKYTRVVETRIPLEEEFPISEPVIGATWLHHQVVPLGDGVVITSRNITTRKNAEQELQESEARYRAFVDHATDSLFLGDELGRVADVNHQACVSLGYTREELIGQLPYFYDSVIQPEGLAQLFTQLQNQQIIAFDSYHKRKDGTTFPVEVRLRPFLLDNKQYTLALARDVTERKRLEAQVQQSQKMEAIGRLAGGVAHDFNNLLTIINGFSELTLRDTKLESTHREALTQIRNAGERASRLTQQLLAYSRKAMVEPKVLDLNEIVTESVKLLRRLIGVDIAVVTALAPELHPVRVDRGQIEQILLNLVVNARDAMPNGGQITIATRNVEIERADCHNEPDLIPGLYAELTVTDTGTGMPAEVQAHIFEPFFTTKGLGRGTGLGLAMVHGAVNQSGGHIRVESKLGTGTKFLLLFPAVKEPPPPSGIVHQAHFGTETILLVEDEEPVRTMMQQSLQSHGYHVLTAHDGTSALALAAEKLDSVDLVVTDVIMPKINGRQLATQLRQQRPLLRVLYVSGYHDDVFATNGSETHNGAFLQKPFSPQDLARKVRELLDSQSDLNPGKAAS